MISTIIFDAEGVIFDTESIWDRVQVEFLQRRGVRYDRDAIKPLLTGRSLVEGVRVMQSLYRFQGNPESLALERLAIAREFLTTGVRFVDGFLEFYEHVRDNSKTCIATAMHRELFHIVELTLNLYDFFGENIFFLDEVGEKGKPEPDIFLYAAKQMQSPVEECLVIEDAPLGITAAKSAGMRCVALTTTYTREKLYEADVVVDSFAQLMDLPTCFGS